MLHIYIDADSCPVKPEVYKVAQHYDLKVTLVANSWMRTPNEFWINMEVVGDAMDAADDWIAEHVEPDDIVVTDDVPLANRCLAAGAPAINPRGKLFTPDNMGESLAFRNLLAEIRAGGELTGGPAPLTKRDRSQFVHQLDEVVQGIRRK